ncbi:MAG TPA: Type 1 glutamine amidotransferase-like domain-containing protein [Kofleriaceae bacterium]|nr:Type 1 glutamine amidotransferase-like domain-containing protein [Kofleriaceae bacterium]
MIVLLGAQHAEPSVRRVRGELGVTGPIAMITAGWQEREGEPGVVADPGVASIELALHARGEQVFADDPELAEAYKARQLKLKLMQEFYRVRLEHAAQAARAVAVRNADPELAAEEHAASRELIRHLDRDHLDRCRAVHAAFEAAWAPLGRRVLARHVDELRAAIEPARAIVIAGGHVAVLLNRLRLFAIAELAGGRPIIAWSAGAMALTERVVLFHDDPPHGQAISEVLDAGLGLARDLVVLPEPRLRLDLDDRARVGELAQRYAPAVCVAVDHGTQIWIDGGRAVRAASAQRLDPDGTVEDGWSP